MLRQTWRRVCEMPYKQLRICLGETEKVACWDVGFSEELTDDLERLLPLPLSDRARRPEYCSVHKERHSPWHAEQSETCGRRRWPERAR